MPEPVSAIAGIEKRWSGVPADPAPDGARNETIEKLGTALTGVTLPVDPRISNSASLGRALKDLMQDILTLPSTKAAAQESVNRWIDHMCAQPLRSLLPTPEKSGLARTVENKFKESLNKIRQPELPVGYYPNAEEKVGQILEQWKPTDAALDSFRAKLSQMAESFFTTEADAKALRAVTTKLDELRGKDSEFGAQRLEPVNSALRQLTLSRWKAKVEVDQRIAWLTAEIREVALLVGNEPPEVRETLSKKVIDEFSRTYYEGNSSMPLTLLDQNVLASKDLNKFSQTLANGLSMMSFKLKGQLGLVS